MLNRQVDGGRVGGMGVLDVDQRAAAEVHTQRDTMPERHGTHSRDAEDQREGQEVPLFPEEIDVCVSKEFHAAYDPFKNQSLVVGPWSFGVRRSFDIRERLTTNDQRLP